MFGVGLHFHLKDLMEVRGIAIPGALLQSTVATLLGLAVGTAFGWPITEGIVLGMALSVASTVVLLRGLEAHNLLGTPAGHVAIGWLIVEDLLTVVVLVVIPALGQAPRAAVPGGGLAASLGIALAKLGALVALVFFAGSRVVPWSLSYVARLRSRELFTLTVLALAVAIATAAAVFFGASMALGAFLAGMVVGQSPVSQQAAADALPLRDAFAVLFFVSVGMLFEPAFLLREPMLLLAALGVVLVGKPLAALVVVAVLGYSTRTALVVAVGLAQVGEFSFILARRRPILWRLLNAAATRRREGINRSAAQRIGNSSSPLSIVVGYGPVEQAVDRVLRDVDSETVVIDLNLDTVADLARKGRLALYGDASHADILKQAGISRASTLVVTLPHSVNRAPLVLAARRLNPGCRIYVRARYLKERAELEQVGAHAACFEELEAAVALTARVLADLGIDAATIAREADRVRRETMGEPPW